MTAADIKAAYKAGNSTFEVLHMVIESGMEYPDAVFKVSSALRLKKDEVAEMEEKYDTCC